MCFVECLKLCRALHELGHLWNAEREFTSEGYPDIVKQRGINMGHEVLYVLDGAFISKTRESGEDGARWRRRAPDFLVNVGRFKSNGQIFEVGQNTQASNDLLG